MTFDEYQEAVWDLALPQCKDMTYMALGLGEAGEIQGKIKKILRGDKTIDQQREGLKGELGDLLYYVAGEARALGLTLSEVAEYNIEKLHDRRERGVLQGDGDNR